ncbi:hypothetical protein DY000_02023582 [Brassica cretica]|uniref:F-box associated domain-containing protein n=1 Tax=Brassica cretica TaxID=69181 RepID=A0ABQ7EFZ0_BRACR|nr:hypothetical protein DY000_02023582 [Brassica cretica]
MRERTPGSNTWFIDAQSAKKLAIRVHNVRTDVEDLLISLPEDLLPGYGLNSGSLEGWFATQRHNITLYCLRWDSLEFLPLSEINVLELNRES